jgi:hypothetical protein
MTIRTFQALIHIESPMLATSKLVANIDPNLPLIPQSLIDFLMKRLCGVLLAKLQSAAKKVSRDPVTNPHAIKMREERAFYEGWLLPKFQGVCKFRGWDMPPISAFELSEAQVDLANALAAKKHRKTGKHGIKMYHSLSSDKIDDPFDGSQSRNSAGSEPANVGHSSLDDEPRFRSVSEDASYVSDLSRNSSSTASMWRSNPISSYLREIEERTELRKAREIEKSRKRAADRLKPRDLDEESQSRLEELRTARSRRVAGGAVTTDHPEDDFAVETSPSASRSLGTQKSIQPEYDGRRDWAVFWTGHGKYTRIFIIHFLMASLFFLLYLDTAFNNLVAFHADSFWDARGRDLATLVYLGITGWVHFFLCYVALMYAFASLQLGTIAGMQAKKFYSQNIHLLVGIASASMVGMGIVKSAFFKFLQWLVWQVYSLSGLFRGWMPSLPEAIANPVSALFTAISSVLSWTEEVLLNSNVVGRNFLTVLGFFWRFFHGFYDRCTLYVDHTIDIYQGIAISTPWREDAFVATRAMFSYSATFLLVLLLLFSLSASQARNADANTKRNDGNNDSHVVGQLVAKQSFPTADAVGKESVSTSIEIPAMDSDAAGVPNTAARGRSFSADSLLTSSSASRTKRKFYHFTRSLSPGFDTIHEEEASTEKLKASSVNRMTGFLGIGSESGSNGGIRFRGSKASSSSM